MYIDIQYCIYVCIYVDGDEEGESDEDESDSDWSDSDEEDEGGENKLDDTTCPQGCEEELFDLACQLREKRLDIEDALGEEKKLLDTLKKDLESLKKKAKIMEAGVKTADSDLQAFQVSVHSVMAIKI